MTQTIDKGKLRKYLFQYLDGIACCPTFYALHKAGVTEYLLENKSSSLSSLSTHFEANDGYLNVALRMLVSQGWLAVDQSNSDWVYSINENSKEAFGYFEHYHDIADILSVSKNHHKRIFQKEPFRVWYTSTKNYRNLVQKSESASPILEQVLTHIEGALLAPSAVHLGMSGMFHKYFMQHSFRPEEFHKDTESFTLLLEFFVDLGWFEQDDKKYTFTRKGLFFAKRCSAFGVTVSYNPIFSHLDELIFGDPTILRSGPRAKEIHVDRAMNVWGSGGAHKTYFKKIDKIVTEIFNQPLELQPKGILDMGCGNGAYLKHLYYLIESNSKRGEHLESHPLFLVGADYNQEAIEITRKNLINDEIWAKVIWGDIGDPKRLADDLSDNYGIHLEDLLNVRSFLDHNRPWSPPLNEVNNAIENISTGAFASNGKKLENAVVQQSLFEHLSAWKPFIKKHGLLIIELHTIDPNSCAENIGRTAATAYDATHGFSDQYILESGIFDEVAAEAGLKKVESASHYFPNKELATVSIQHFKIL